MNYPHWQYYRSLSEDLEKVSRYIEVSPDNFNVYSIELTRMLLAIGSEIDVVAKLLCEQVDQTSRPRNIVDYGEILLPQFPNLVSVVVTIARYGISFTPWRDWTLDRRPQWWGAYNDVKHQRNVSFEKANLENTLNALAGLCVFNCYLYFKDFISGGLATNRPFMFLDSSYNYGGKRLRSPEIQLPDFANDEQDATT